MINVVGTPPCGADHPLPHGAIVASRVPWHEHAIQPDGQCCPGLPSRAIDRPRPEGHTTPPAFRADAFVRRSAAQYVTERTDSDVSHRALRQRARRAHMSPVGMRSHLWQRGSTHSVDTAPPAARASGATAGTPPGRVSTMRRGVNSLPGIAAILHLAPRDRRQVLPTHAPLEIRGCPC